MLSWSERDNLSLKTQTISGVKWTTLSTVVVNILQLTQIAILSRFLDPTAFGLMALVTVVIGFSQAFLDMGISNAIIHKQQVSQDQLSTLYWINVLAGLFLFIIICGVAPFVASFYKETELTKLIILVAMSFLVQPFGQQFMVLWQKEMRFREIAKIEIITKSFTFVVSVWLAYRGFGVYALVFGTLAGSVVQTTQFIAAGMREYRPSFVFRIMEVKEYISFGAYQMGERTVNYFNYQIDTMLIGKLLGVESLGIYTIAKQLIMKPADIFNPIVTKVTFPAMSKIQNETAKLKGIYLKTVNYLSSINFPVYAFIFVFADDIVSILFGIKWIKAVPIIKILSIWGALRSTINPIGSLLLAKGRANLGFWYNLALFFIVPGAIYVGSHWGLLGVCWTLLLLLFPFTMVAAWYFLVQPLCDAGFIEYHLQIFKPASIALIAGIFAYLSIYLLDFGVLKFSVGTVVGLLFALWLNWAWNREFLVELKGIKGGESEIDK